MAAGALSIKLRCASWQQLATIYKRDLSRGTMFLKASTPPPVGTAVRIDLTLPSGSVIVLLGNVDQHVDDPTRGAGVELKLNPIPQSTTWMIESALAAEANARGGRTATPATGVPVVAPASDRASGPVMAVTDGEEVASAEAELIRALVSEAESLKKLNPFLVLGVGYEASDDDVRAAFGELTKRYHPDRFARYQSTELRQTAAEIFILIRDAYRKLGDEAGRQQMLASLGRSPAPRAVAAPRPAGPPPLPPRAMSQRIATPPGGVPIISDPSRPAGTPPPPPVAVIGAPRAIVDHKSGPVRAVIDQKSGPVRVPPAVTTPLPPNAKAGSQPLQPVQRPTPPPPVRPPPPPSPANKHEATTANGAVDATGATNLPGAAAPVEASKPIGPITDASDAGQIEELLDLGRHEEALAAYRLLAKKHPSDRNFRAGIELCEGLAALGQRDRLEAAQRFEAALEIDPSNERAARELADMRRQATNERKGLLSRLMGKKES